MSSFKISTHGLRVAALAVAGLLAAGASSVHALTLAITDASPSNLNEQIKWTKTGATPTYPIGTQNAHDTSFGSDTSNDFIVYCIDPLTNYTSPNSYTVASLNSYLTGAAATPGTYAYQFALTNYTNQLTTPTKLVSDYQAQAAATVSNRLVDLYSHAYADSLTTSIKGAAFQYAIWEVIGESSLTSGGTTGGLQYGPSNSDSSFKTQADAYLLGVSGGSWAGLASTNNTYTYTVYMPAPSSQAFIRVATNTVTNTGNGNGVPEPSTVALAMIAMLAWVGARRAGLKATSDRA